MPRFEVLLPVRNGAAYLQQAIDSIAAQSLADWRLRLIDHSSTDETRSIAEAAAARDRRIVVESMTGGSFVDVLNHGMSHCDCEYLIRQDADDISDPRRLEVTADAFPSVPDAVVLGGQAQVISDAGTPIGRTQYPCSVEAVAAAALFYNPVSHPCVAIDMARFRASGARYGVVFVDQDVPTAVDGLVEDYLLFGQFAILKAAFNVDRRLIKYRRHDGSVSSRNADRQHRMACDLSRLLGGLVERMYGVDAFNPVVFSNHSARLSDPADKGDYRGEYAALRHALLTSFGGGSDVLRELSFRRVLADRRRLPMAARFARFGLRHWPTQFERGTVTSWLRAA